MEAIGRECTMEFTAFTKAPCFYIAEVYELFIQAGVRGGKEARGLLLLNSVF